MNYRLNRIAARTIVTLFLVLLVTQVWANSPGYEEVRKVVEDANPNNNTPAAERVFVDCNFTNRYIVQFREGITLRDLINQTQSKGKDVNIIVMRKQESNRPVFSGSIKSSDNSIFALKPEDVAIISNSEFVF